MPFAVWRVGSTLVGPDLSETTGAIGSSRWFKSETARVDKGTNELPNHVFGLSFEL